jgi:lysophospholipase L1-like esterase
MSPVRPGRVALGAVVMFTIALLSLEVVLQVAALSAPVVIRAAAPSGPGHADDVTILVVGDSHAAGAGVPREDNLPSQLERMLAERHPDRAFRIVNLGLPGVNSPWVANRLERNIRLHNPDLIISWVGVNDIWNATETDAWGNSSWALAVRRLLLRSKVFRLATVIWHTRGYDAESRNKQIREASRHQAKPPDAELARGLGFDLERMAGIAHEYGVPIIFMNYPVPYAVVNDTIRRTAGELRVPLVDTVHDLARAKGEGHDQSTLLTFAAGPHPTGLLYRYVAESTLPTVEELLREEVKLGAPEHTPVAG